MIDWNRIWKLSLLASRGGRLENGRVKEATAERYHRSEAGRREKSSRLEIDPSWPILGIGAGQGTPALPLSQRAETL
jgi:hypothetical protein